MDLTVDENETNLILDQPLVENKTESEKDFEKMKEDDISRMNQNEGDLEQIKMRQKQNILIWKTIEEKSCDDNKVKNVRNKIYHSYHISSIPYNEYLIEKYKSVKDIFNHYRTSIVETDDESFYLLVFIRILAISREHYYILNDRGEDLTDYFLKQCSLSSLQELLDICKSHGYDINEKKIKNQIRNFICKDFIKKFKFILKNEELKNFKDLINEYESVEDIEQFLKDYSKEHDCDVDKVNELVQSRERKTKVVGITNIGQWLHIYESAYFKIRFNYDFNQKLEAIRRLISFFPYILELPQIFFNVSSKIYGKDVNSQVIEFQSWQEVPDVGLLFNECLDYLRLTK